jgi:N-methylhydantoinase B
MDKCSKNPARRPEGSTSLDPITAEVIRCAFDNIADEMAIVLLRTSGSPVLTEAKDFSAVVFDVQGRQIGTAGYVLAHLASSRIAIQEIMKQRLPDDLEPGDIFACSDPYSAGALHQGDVGIVMPIHDDETLIGWAFANAHLIDVGGTSISGIAPQAHDCFEEAIRFPGVRVGRNGVLDGEWARFIGSNVRVPVSFINDVRSLVAACHAGAERMRGLVAEYGMPTLRRYIDHNIALTEKAFRERIAELPDGVAHTYDWVEYDGRGSADLHAVFCEMSVDGDRLAFSFSGVAQVAAFINATPSAVAGAGVMTPIVCMLAYDIPFNEGIWNCIEIDTGEPGTIVNPRVPAPVSNAHMETGIRLGRMVAESLSVACALSGTESLRDRAAGQAPSTGAGAAWFGMKNENELTVFFPLDNLVAIGGGAQTTGDGQDLYGFQATLAVSFPDVEVHELIDPFFVLWRRFAVNSGGAGRNRGGMAMEQAYTLWGADHFGGSVFMAAVELPARGFSGGYPGAAGRSAVIRNSDVLRQIENGRLPSAPEKLDGELDLLPAKGSNVPLNRGDVYWAISSGGGGLGDPFLRPPEQVARDLDTGRITRSAAEALYGAVVAEDNGSIAIDIDATWENRDRLRTALVPGKTRPLKDVAAGGVLLGVTVEDGQWRCAHCGTGIGSTGQQWKEQLRSVRHPLADIFETAETPIRRRHDQPAFIAERYCPECAACLSVDIEVDGSDRTPPGFAFK